METTDGYLLGGRIRYRQPAAGHRTGIEPVLLAAAVPAQAGELVLEGGTGAGAGLLCLGARVPGLRGTGVEIDPGTVALARHNLADNGLADWRVLEGDVTALVLPGDVDHAFANPPWYDPAGTPSPDMRRRLARQVYGAGLPGWARALVGAVRVGGTVTLILPERQGPEALRALDAAGCGEGTLVPLWPKHGRPARIVLVQGRRGSRRPGRITRGLALHEEHGAYTPEAEAILRLGAPLRV